MPTVDFTVLKSGKPNIVFLTVSDCEGLKDIPPEGGPVDLCSGGHQLCWNINGQLGDAVFIEGMESDKSVLSAVAKIKHGLEDSDCVNFNV